MTQRLLTLVFLAGMFLPCLRLSAQETDAHKLSPECTGMVAPVIPGSDPAERSARIFIGSARNARYGNGQTPDRPLDGSTAAKFDAILRRYSGNPVGDPSATPPAPAVLPVSHLIVCLGPGNFQTEGAYDFVINIHHASERGFALGPYWHVHGAGMDKTMLQLITFYVPVAGSPVAKWVHSGDGVVFQTVSDATPGIEISDLAIDANYPTLKPRASQMGFPTTNLEAIHLRSDVGGHYVHHVSVINASGETREAFPIWIFSVNNPVPPAPPKNTGNIIEHVDMKLFGKGKCTAIALSNATGEVRFNRVESYFIGYGGWQLSQGSHFHDNIAFNTVYGFNVDSLSNTGWVIDHNQVVHPAKYGIVIGENGSFTNFQVLDNKIVLNQSRSIGILLQGHASQGTIARNSILTEGSTSGARAFANKGPDNTGNNFLNNTISDSLDMDSGLRKTNCFSSNRNQGGAAHRNVPDTQAKPCGGQ